jgi:hypothetical protein
LLLLKLPVLFKELEPNLARRALPLSVCRFDHSAWTAPATTDEVSMKKKDTTFFEYSAVAIHVMRVFRGFYTAQGRGTGLDHQILSPHCQYKCRTRALLRVQSDPQSLGEL